MRTLFCFFDRDTDAARAVADLQGRGCDPAEMSLAMPAARLPDTGGPSPIEHPTLQDGAALQDLVAGGVSLRVEEAGEIFAAGPLAALLARSETYPDLESRSLAEVLGQFDLPGGRARAYAEEVREGGVLFFLRVPDEQAAQALETLRARGGHMLHAHVPDGGHNAQA